MKSNIEKTCEICGKEYIAHSYNRKCCSEECKREKNRIYKIGFNRKHRHKRRAEAKVYREKNKGKIKKYLHKNKDHIKNRQQKYNKKNKDRIREFQKKYYLDNIDYIKSLATKSRLDNLERVKILQKKWRKENKDHVYMLNNLRREKERKTKGFKDKIENFRKRMAEIGECIFCGSKENLTIEHLIPISKNGTNEIHNLFPSCKRCNCSKNASDWIEWYRKQEFYSIGQECLIIELNKT